MLCSWLDNPSLYQWVKFEADDLEDARGLDDIVFQQADQRLGLIQVKFTVDPFDPANALSWVWLTERKGKKGKSLLEKWSSAAFNIGLENLAELRLVSNRRPDADFAAHLSDGKVDLAALPGQLRDQVLEHFIDSENAARFFERFEFSHSYAGYESLERDISAALESRHTDHTGSLTLQWRAFQWSIYKNAPWPDGCITLEILRSTISERQPRPLNQEFRIPAGYLPPAPEFADAFVEQAETGRWTLRVLWGSPGQGKSTFLSHVCERLGERDLPFIRHHYFLDLQDPSDRLSLKSVAHSLMTQMRATEIEGLALLRDGPENLREWIATCGQAYATEGKRFFVLIDGLDHIWRENDGELAPMEALFVQLLPLPANVTLILGTQRVDQSKLPRRLNTYLEPEHWVELPRMGLHSVQAWLGAQHDAGTFCTECKRPLQDELTELSSTFERVSEGHPLVLTYTFLALTSSNRILTEQLVENSTPVPLGDVQIYYKALWQRLSWKAKDALHLMAEDGFIWPTGALERCLNTGDSNNLESEIGHLLAVVDAGLVAFHGSLYVFITSQPDHVQRIQALQPNVETWLAAEAPEYLRWAWLWIYKSRRGEHDELLAGTTRTWAVKALARAYPPRQIELILEAAEEVAFAAGDYEQAIRKRSLKVRIYNGLQFQLDDASMLENCALRLTPDPYPSLLLASEVSQSSITGLHQLAMLYLSLGQIDRAAEVQERMRRKINDRIQTRALQTHEYEGLLEQYLEVTAGTGHYEPKRVVGLLRRQKGSEEIFARFLNLASQSKDLSAHMAFCREPMPLMLRQVLEIEALRTAAWAQASLHEWGEFERFKKHPLSVCWSLLYRGADKSPDLPNAPPHEALASQVGNYDEPNFARYLHFVFFAAVGRTLQLSGAQDPIGLGVSTNRQWLNKALDRLAMVAHTCGSLLARGEVPAFSLVYRTIGLERPKANDHESWSDLRALRKALVLITADLFFLSRPRSCLAHVPDNEWARCKESDLFALDHWREIFLARHYRLLNEEAVQADIVSRERAIHSTIGPFNEKANELADLCSWATAYELDEIAERLLNSSYRCTLGYGWRKDWLLPRLLEAVEEVSQYEPNAAVSAVEKLAPIYTSIDEMTEDSGARKSDLAGLLMKLMPDVFARYYRFWLDHGEWYDAEKAFATFAKEADLQSQATEVAMAFLWAPQTQTAVRTNVNSPAATPLARWTGGVPPVSQEQDSRLHSENESEDESKMPNVEDYPPVSLPEFLSAVSAAHQFKLDREWASRWFRYWETVGRGSELLTAVDAALQSNLLSHRATELFDMTYDLSRRLEGPAKAFRWLVDAHRYRHGWSEGFYGRSDSAQRISIVAQHYPKRWSEFVALSSVPIPDYVQRGRVIPDTSLISLLLQVGEVQRAVQILLSMVDIAVEEFEMQPLVRPAWLDGTTA